MPMYNGNYAAPVWVNGVPPTIGATELEAVTGTAERSQVLHGSGAPGSGTAGEIGQLYADMSASPVEFYRMTGVSAGGGFIWESEHDIEDNLTTTYDSSGTYAAGDFCLYGGLLYEAAVDILTPEEWTAAHWQGVTAADAETAHFARRDNPHEVTAAQAGLGNVENVIQYSAANPAIKRGTVALEGTWSGAASPYTKTITVTGPTVTGKSYVELQFTPAQMDSLMSRGVRSVHVYNNGGVLTAMAWGGVPGNMTAQCTVEELGVNAYLRFHSTQRFYVSNYHGSKDWDGHLYYSTDGATWLEWDGTAAIFSGDTNEIFMRGKGNTVITGMQTQLYNERWLFTPNIYVECDGNIECLLDWRTVAAGRHPEMGPGCFQNMFYNNQSLKTAPDLLSTTLSEECYANMFRGCINLETVGKVSASTLARECCQSMFYGCTSLLAAPELPATTLADSCYEFMFYGCTSLETAGKVSATTLAKSSCKSMFGGCASLVNAPEFAATTLAESCCEDMFLGCTSLVNAPELPATTLARKCYQSMFNHCASLVNAPALPATTLADYCYANLLYYCTSLESIPELPATTLADSCYFGMFAGSNKIKLATSLSGEYTTPYRIPSSGTGTTASSAMNYMFTDTGGTFTGTPTINTTYYTSNTVVPAT